MEDITGYCEYLGDSPATKEIVDKDLGKIKVCAFCYDLVLANAKPL
jgi:hypothetical protein